jgi:hypothetical protein
MGILGDHGPTPPHVHRVAKDGADQDIVENDWSGQGAPMTEEVMSVIAVDMHIKILGHHA